MSGCVPSNTTTPTTEVEGVAMYDRITPEGLLRQRSSSLTIQEHSVGDHPSNGEDVVVDQRYCYLPLLRDSSKLLDLVS